MARVAPATSNKPRADTPPGSESFPLLLGWVAVSTLLVPLFMVLGALAAVAWLARGTPAEQLDATWLVAAGALALSIRGAVFARVAIADHCLILREQDLCIPAVTLLRFRRRVLRYDEIASVEAAREPGSSTEIVFRLRDGSALTVPAHFFDEQARVLSAIQRRLPA